MLFIDASSIQVSWSTNNATFLNSGRTTIDFSGNNIPAGASIDVSNNESQVTYHLPSGTLAIGGLYTVTINGYCLIPSNLYPSKWVSPTLTNYKYPATPVTISSTYATAPGPVSNITDVTDIDASGGLIQYTWTAAPANGDPVYQYYATLWSVDASGNRTYAGFINTTATNCLFTGLNTTLLYTIGIQAQNNINVGPIVWYPSPTTGIPIVDSVNTVENLSGAQTLHDASGQFFGELAWTYPSGAGPTYTNTRFQVLDASNQILSTVLYDPSINIFREPNVRLGNVVGVPKQFTVKALADIGTTVYTSAPSSITIVPGLAPIISNVHVFPDPSGNSVLQFTVTNTSVTTSMVQDSIVSGALPNPLSLLQDPKLPSIFYNGYDVSFVDSATNRSFTYTHSLGYPALGADFVAIIAANTVGASLYNPFN